MARPESPFEQPSAAFFVITPRVDVGDKKLFSWLDRPPGNDCDTRKCSVLIEMAHGNVGCTRVIKVRVKLVQSTVCLKI